LRTLIVKALLYRRAAFEINHDIDDIGELIWVSETCCLAGRGLRLCSQETIEPSASIAWIEVLD